jgi:hypothetical protein
MPADFKLIEARRPPLKDQYDEWLARIICYAFSVPVSPFVSQVNRATGETMRQQATQEGLVPLKAWVKNALDHVIHECMNEPGLEFVWVGDDATDPLEQAQTLQILVGAGIKTREEARADLGLAPVGGKAPAGPPVAKRGATRALLGKYNPHHDERGLFATADGAIATVGSPARKPRPTAVQVASLGTMSDVGGDANSQAIEIAQISEPLFIKPPPAELPVARPGQGAEVSPTEEAAPSAPPPSEAESTAEENSPSDFASTDQDEITEFGSTRGPRFASGDLLESKFNKHGSDFGALTASEYENQAASFLSDPDNADVLQFTRKGGDIVRFNPLTDEFGVLGSDGTIHTYYRPNPQIHGKPTNLDYFYSQKGRVR